MNPLNAPEHRTLVEDFSRKHRTSLVTLAFTDMEGSTELKQRLGDRAGTAFFDRHHRIVRETLSKLSGGQEIETAGDSFLIIFSTPSDAVQFALLLQARLRNLARENGLSALDRIGVHMGEVVIKDQLHGQRPKDFLRSVDYLHTRQDIDHNKLGYVGLSLGARRGLMLLAVEDRVKTAVLIHGGFRWEAGYLWWTRSTSLRVSPFPF